MSAPGDFDAELERLIAQLLVEPGADVLPLLARCPEHAGGLVQRILELRSHGILPPPGGGRERAVEVLKREHGLTGVSLARGDVPPADDGLPAELVAGRYRFVAHVAGGGMGELYEGYDLDLGRAVALKVLRRPLPAGAFTPGGVFARFLNEACLTAQLDHPAIVPVHDLGLLSDRRMVMVMKLVRGRSLREWITAIVRDEPGARARFTPRAVLETIVTLCRVVAHAHRHGVLHRDLKPGNVMIGAVGEVYLMDWGIAKLLEGGDDGAGAGSAPDVESPDLTSTGDTLGSPSYMSPEQARGETDRFDRRTDVFGLGALIYHFATGNPPFWGADSAEVFERAKAADLNDPEGKKTRRPVRRELLAVCRKAMAFEPERRYASAEELIADLEAVLEERSGRAWTDPFPVRTVKLVRRHPRAAALVTAAALVVLVGSVAQQQVVQARSREREATERKRELEGVEEARALTRELAELDERETRGSTTLGLPAASGDPQFHQSRADQDVRVARFAASARDLVAVLRRFGISLEEESASIASGLRWHPNEHARAPLLTALYSLAKHLAISGVVRAAAAVDHPSTEESVRADFRALLAAHPDLAPLWRRIELVLEAYGGQESGLGAMAALEEWFREDVKPAWSPGLEEEAGDEQLEFVSFCCQQLSSLDEEARFLASMVRARPKLFWPHARLARTAIHRASLLEDERERRALLVTAVGECFAALAVWPEAASARLNLGLCWMDLRELDQARAVYEDLVETHPDLAAAWFNLAQIHRWEQRWDEAIRAIDEARRLDPTDPAVHMLRGLVHDSCAEATGSDVSLTEAVASFARYVELLPQDWKGHLQLGRARLLGNEFDAAIADFDRGLALHPHGRDLRTSKADALWGKGELVPAAELLAELLDEFPDDGPGIDLARYFLEAAPDEARAKIEALLAERVPAEPGEPDAR